MATVISIYILSFKIAKILAYCSFFQQYTLPSFWGYYTFLTFSGPVVCSMNSIFLRYKFHWFFWFCFEFGVFFHGAGFLSIYNDSWLNPYLLALWYLCRLFKGVGSRVGRNKMQGRKPYELVLWVYRPSFPSGCGWLHLELCPAFRPFAPIMLTQPNIGVGEGRREEK